MDDKNIMWMDNKFMWMDLKFIVHPHNVFIVHPQVLCWTVWGGLMRAYTPMKLTDKFFLGGGTFLRDFGLWGVGPRQNGTMIQIKVIVAISISDFSPQQAI